MLKNYLKTAWRNAIKSKAYTVLNITGLAVGIACVLLIFAYVLEETSYDTIHPNPNDTYGIGEVLIDREGNESTYPAVPTGWAQLMEEQIPEVRSVLRVLAFGYPYSMKNPDTNYVQLTKDGEVFFVENSFPEVLHFDLIYGNESEVFSQTNSVVISEKVARRLFGSTDVIGRTIALKHIYVSGEYTNLKVSGIMKDYPENAHLRPDYLMPISFLDQFFQNNLGVSDAKYLSSLDAFYAASYVRFEEGTDIQKMQEGLDRIIEENLRENASKHEPFLRNIKDFHFDEAVDWSWWDGTYSFDYIVIFSFIGLVILLIACINYMNLATSRSVKRSKEVGVRKSLGSSRSKIVIQFLQESLLFSFVAVLVSLVIVAIALPLFNQVADKNLTLVSLLRLDLILFLFVVCILVAFLAGSYPALFLSSFKPVEVLKGQLTFGKGPGLFRRVLVILQLIASVLLMVCTGVVLQQMGLLKNTKLYMAADQIVSIRYGSVAPIEKYATLRNEILNDSGIDDVTLSIHLPQREGFAPLNASLVFPEISRTRVYDWPQINGDYNFTKMFDLDILAGREFKRENGTDSTNFILNETAVKALNKTPNEVLGMPLLDTITKQMGTIVGVVRDFSFESVQSNIKPMVIQGRPHPENQILYVKIPKGKIKEKLELLESKWKSILPDVGFDYWFLDEEFERMYYTEKKMSNLVQFFAVLAIFISCLGLYGLASYTAEQKTKEIGIRKILGATVPQILKMLLSDFIRMIIIACLIAFPIGYYVMDKWLENFAYNAGIGWFVFLAAIFVILSLTLFTVAYESIKVALAQPANSLRHE